MKQLWMVLTASAALLSAACNDESDADKISQHSVSSMSEYSASRRLPEAAEKMKTLVSGEGLASQTDEEIAEYLSGCKSLILDLAKREEIFFDEGQVMDSTWDGSIGASGQILKPSAFQSIRERIEYFRENGVLNTEIMLFGLRDTFSGIKRDFRVGRCENTGSRIGVRVCPIDTSIGCVFASY